MEGAQVGQRYLVVRPTVRHVKADRRECCDLLSRNDYDFRGRRVALFGLPWSETASPEADGEVLGHELMRVNAGSVTKTDQGRHRVTTLKLDDGNGFEVRVGDRIIPVDARQYDLQFFPHAPKSDPDPQYGRVLSVASSLTTGGPYDVVALAVGARDGVDNGTVFSIWRQGTNEFDRVEMGRYRGTESVAPRTAWSCPTSTQAMSWCSAPSTA